MGKAKQFLLKITATAGNPTVAKCLLVFLAALPSCIFYFFIPFLWNNTDAVTYFIQGLQSAVPQYPPLYNGICLSLMHLLHGSVAVIYIIIGLQHVVYIGGLLYLACIFRGTTARIVFLFIMGFNFNILMVVNGIFPEGLFAGFQLFFWGGFLRFVFRPSDRLSTGLAWMLSLILLTLTKHIGQLWYALPVVTFAYFLITGTLTGKNSDVKLAVRILGRSVISFLVLVLFQHGLMWYLQIHNPTTIGRQGIYRIKEIPWDSLGVEQKEALLQNYTGWSKDPMLRTTYQTLFATHPWGETYDALDSLLQLKHITDKTPDDYFNEAYFAYLLHIEHYGIKSMENDLAYTLTDEYLPQEVIKINTISVFENHEYYWPQRLEKIHHNVFSDKNYKAVKALFSSEWLTDPFYSTPEWFIRTNIFLFCCCLLKFRSRKMAMLFLPVGFAIMGLAITCILTVILPRYLLPAYHELHMVYALLVTLLFFTPRAALIGKFNRYG